MSNITTFTKSDIAHLQFIVTNTQYNADKTLVILSDDKKSLYIQCPISSANLFAKLNILFSGHESSFMVYMENHRYNTPNDKLSNKPYITLLKHKS